jgi:hypothetical protein
MDRSTHAGKSRAEKARYFEMLKQKQAAQPTINEDGIDRTTSDDKGLFQEVEDEQLALKPYSPKNNFAIPKWVIDLGVGIVLAVVVLFLTTTNREVGVLSERIDRNMEIQNIKNDNLSKKIDDFEVKIDKVIDKIDTNRNREVIEVRVK